MTGSLGKNPYRPGVGTKPTVLAGREAEIKRFMSTLRGSPEIPANIRLTGLRGVGKTVLLAEFAARAQDQDWAVGQLEVEPRHNSTEAISETLIATCVKVEERLSLTERVKSRLGKAVQSVANVGVTYGDVRFSLDPALSPSGVELAEALEATVKAAVSQGKTGFALLLDEAQVLKDETSPKGEHPLSLLLSAASGVQKAGLPLAVVLCGLPTLTGNLLKARTYSERMFRGEIIESLELESARRAFVEPVVGTDAQITIELEQAVLEAVEGYPYFIQLWGAELWDAASDVGETVLTLELLNAVEPEIYRRLDIDFYEPRIQTLTPAEQDLLLSAAECPYPPLIVADLNVASEKRPGNVNVLLGRLVEAGVIYRLRKAQYEFTAPKFFEFLQRRKTPGPGRSLPPSDPDRLPLS